jgi:serine/threonine protein kinase/formylglycine-generating enzyme required for sulfatase activity
MSGESPVEFVAGTPEVGQLLFGKYVVEQYIGGGGMGEVWLVRHRELEILRALKMIRLGIAVDPSIRRRFRREARVMASLQHPNAVQIHDALIAADAAFIDMEYVPGESVDKLLREGVPMSMDWVARILLQLCDVLQAAHDRGIVHRDLSPSNLMLLAGRPPGHEFLKVLDFGIAKILGPGGEGGGEEEALTAQFSFLGKPVYAGPEQIEGREIDGRSDLYTVGVMLYEFLTGYRPFSGKRIKLLHDHCNTPPPPFAEVNPHVQVPDSVERLVMRCLAKAPEDRPPSAHALAEAFLQSMTGSFELPGTWPPTPPDSSAYAAGPVPYATPYATPPAPMASPTAATEVYNSAAGPAMERTQPMTGHRPHAAGHGPSATSLQDGSADTGGGWGVGGGGRLALLSGVVLTAGALGLAASSFWPTRMPEPAPGSPEGSPLVSGATDGGSKVPGDGPVRSEEVREQLHDWGLAGFREDPEGGTTPEGWPRVLVSRELGRFARDPDGHYLPEQYAMVPEAGYAEDRWPKVLRRKTDGVEFVRIPAGTFVMGVDDKYKLEGRSYPPHEVTLPSGYYIQRFEVTNGEFDRYMRAGREVTLESRTQGWRDEVNKIRQYVADEADIARYPACDLRWEIAQEYARSVGGQLPTEAQWEYAARSGARQYPYVWGASSTESISQLANIDMAVDTPGFRVPMTSHYGEPGRDQTEQGVVMMAGNVSEWCRDEYRPYTPESRIDPPPSPTGRDVLERPYVVRGGSFAISNEYADVRVRPVPCQGTSSRPDIGFRVVLECPAEPGPAKSR